MLCREAYLDDAEFEKVRGAAPGILVAHGMHGRALARCRTSAALPGRSARAAVLAASKGAAVLRNRPTHATPACFLEPL